MKKHFIIMILVLNLFSVSVCAAKQRFPQGTQATELYPFASSKKQTQFSELIYQLRCLVCQDENIASSNASLAAQLRQEVYQMVKAGETDAQIKAYLVKRYGDFVLFKPPVNSRTYLLWFGPFVLLVLAFIALYFGIRRQIKNSRSGAVAGDEVPIMNSEEMENNQ